MPLVPALILTYCLLCLMQQIIPKVKNKFYVVFKLSYFVGHSEVVKGTVNVILSDPSFKYGYVRLTTGPIKLLSD